MSKEDVSVLASDEIELDNGYDTGPREKTWNSLQVQIASPTENNETSEDIRA